MRIFKFRVRGIPQVLDRLRNGSALMTCTALAHATRACSCMVCFSAGHILPELRKFICAMKLWSADRSRPPKKTADPSPRSRSTAVCTTLAYIGLVSSDGPCRFLQRGSIACYAEHCINYDRFYLSDRLSVTRWYHAKRLQLRSCGLHCRIAHDSSFLTVNFSTKFQREHRERGRRMRGVAQM